MAVLPHPPRLPGDPSDKVQHIIAFAVLALLSAAAFPLSRMRLLALALSMFGALIELVQAIPALNRDSQLLDWIADTVASGAMLLFVHWLRQRSRLD